jgi:hypothetical protein
MPSPEERVGRAMVEDTPIGEVRTSLQVRNSMDVIRFPIHHQGDLLPPTYPDGRGNDMSIPVLGKDYIRVKPLQKAVDLKRHIGRHVRIDFQPVSLTFHHQGIPPTKGEQRVSLHANFHGPKRREGVLDLPGGTASFHPQNPAILVLHPTASRGKEASFIEVSLGRGNVAVIKGNPILKPRQQPEKSGNTAIISHLQIQYVHLLPTPEILLPSPSKSEKDPPLPKEIHQPLQVPSAASGVDVMSIGIL